MSNDAPLPLSATYNPLTVTAEVTFDRPLQPGLSSANNWRVYYNLQVAPADNDATILGNTVTFTKSLFDVPAGLPDAIDFSNTVHDLIGLNGMEVQAFTIPYTVI